MGLVSKTLTAIAFCAASTAAHAGTITASQGSTDLATVVCPNCVGYTAPGVTSPTAAQTENAQPSNETAEANFINSMTGTTMFTSGDADKTNSGGAASFDFTSSFQYIVFKIGNQRFLIENFAANSLFEFDQIDGTGSGLSHYTGFGQIAAIPVPAAGLLLGSVLLGGGMVARRRRKQAA